MEGSMTAENHRIRILALLLLTLTACTSPAPAASLDEAEGALRSYFDALHEGRYNKAASLYGGDYDQLQANNPDVDPSDRAGLLERWCHQNGGVCLRIQSVVERGSSSEGTFTFVVEFANDDGSTFEIGPCCGEEDTGERTREFAYTVQNADGGLAILELPPYLP
jgi:hypothetical protein